MSPHTSPSSHEKYFKSILRSVSYCLVILRTPPYWLVRVAMKRSKSTLDCLESVFKAFRRKRSLGTVDFPRGSSGVACVASVSVRFRRKERGTRVKDREKSGASKRALVSFLARSKPKVPFLSISLLRNQTETLATQASSGVSLELSDPFLNFGSVCDKF